MSLLNDLFTYRTLVHAVAGAAGSVVAMTTFFPLDTVRSRLQLEESREAKNTFSILVDLAKEEGFTTLYRGMVPVLESLCASNFVYFYTFHGLKALGATSAHQNARRDLLLASLAGVVNVLTTTPLWVVNTRLKMKGLGSRTGRGSTEHVADQYSGLLDGLKKMGQQEGVASLWNGTLPSLMLVSNPAIQFMTYEAIKRRLQALHGDQTLSALIYFFVGAVAKAVATIITYPLQLVQTKLRHGHNYQDLPQNAGTIKLTVYILKKYGIIGLYKGMEAKLLQTILTAALMFAAYEKIANFVFKVLLNHQKVS
ncbi:peroxisomal membrane protein PMP34 isoform X1 [Zootermopsis nevadensis]|uniref:Peroxisomal membrane protein PMP34 n=2 Tax=Zootermopsis nevadensis TaxID=136037 RepID=A0A067QZR0_ZOONE|nr:peroxisomal membrane protein PMP34 isoform X1 [Zootermopsis nevadensis]XP_021933839.1 peroxisomal membrane protein PMP34 isoform X1 [Zootermopsis nevadensis]KDR11884.1 Peroxisomal membrane protein PMP34 [Zootermopsis nevadensis]